jgi:ATP-dependent DNA helicase DinG
VTSVPGGTVVTVGKTVPSLDELLDAAVSAVPGGARRDGQHTMAHAVADAAAGGEHLLVQAGTGTGKSLAYLVPALHSRRRVVVSTATLALQAQLVEGDLPRLADALTPVLGRRPTYALLKGRQHYLCLAKFEGAAAEDPDAGLFEDDGPKWLAQAGRLGQQMTRIREWRDQTETGDRTELDPGVDETVWRAVSMPSRECIGAQRCPFGEECFAEASRARARTADIVVTNHSLLAVDMVAGRQILPDHDLLVVDEAHELVDRVTAAAQAELSGDTVNRAARRVRPQVNGLVYERLDEAGEMLRAALDAAPVGRLASLPAVLREALTLLDAACRLVVEAIGEVSTDDPDAVTAAQAKAMVAGLSETTQRLLTESEYDVAWTTSDERDRRSLAVAPLSVAAQLGGGLYRNRTVVATSATLALGGRFDLVARSVGLEPRYGRTPATDDSRAEEPPPPKDDDEEPGPQPWRALDVGSPFDYGRQGVLYVAARLPRPGMSGLSEAAQDELVALAEAAGGRTLGLFSSRKAASQAAEVLRARTKLPVLLQGEDTLGHLVRRFREDPETCLLGVMSLWQGVDVPGAACQLVVIDRLPFPRPDDPLSSARSKAVDESGGSGFASVSVPHAAVRLAQGAGRLVRSGGDRGVVAVLDSRLHSARYGDFLRRSLPPFWYTTQRDVVLAALGRLDASAREQQAG